MSTNLEEIKEVQVSLGARGAAFTRQGGAAITGPNGDPRDAANPAEAGLSTLTSVGERPAVISAILAYPGDDVTAYSFRVWSQTATPEGLRWAVAGDGEFSKTRPFKEMIPTGNDQRIYFELISADGTEGVDFYLGPCDPAAAG